ncbi:hypothetical protein BDB01DRAFT_780013 [Pilobolus umbonatus]|nr:hypothetical protein BDB01DRAFT_780013 [Pilobolus umbonatus]
MRALGIKRLNVKYTSCGALHFKGEKTSGTQPTPFLSTCCKQGKVRIPFLSEPLQMLKDLFTGNHEKSVRFLKNSRQYNAAFSFLLF